ncbi:MAG: HAMP domain-containing histidine kinase [Deltaproteobacteria bacterium]|nr:HAMP domain-containing histidine kinase [Deltaproteobacteria bacterium]
MNALLKKSAPVKITGSSVRDEKRMQSWKRFSHDIKESMMSIDKVIMLTDLKMSDEIDTDAHREARNILNSVHGSISDLNEFLSIVISEEQEGVSTMPRKPWYKAQSIINPELNELNNKDKKFENNIYARMAPVGFKKSFNMIKDIVHPVLREINDKDKKQKNHIVTKTGSLREEEAWVIGNQFLLKSVLRNLIQSAVRYNDAGREIYVGIKKSGPFLNVNVLNRGKTVVSRTLLMKYEKRCL